MFQLVSGAVGLGIATTVFTGVVHGHSGPPDAGFVAGFQAVLRLEAAIAACGLVTLCGMFRPDASGPQPARPSEPATVQ